MKKPRLLGVLLGLSSLVLVGCADMTALQQMMGNGASQSRLTLEQLNEQCPAQEKSHLWTPECWQWQLARIETKRRSDEAARKAAQEAEAIAYIEQQQQQQQQKLREAEEREKAAVQADERAGYKYLSFQDFALDGAKMQGAKVALYGVYVGKGKRLASNQLAALMWTERSHIIPTALIPLVTTEATRESRATLLDCDSSPLGCGIVVRGRVRMLTLQNAFGASSRELGVVVESVR